MPGGTGLEIIADLRARNLMMRTLLITGTHDADTAWNAQGLDGMTID